MRRSLGTLGLQAISLFLAFIVWLFVSAPRRERPREQWFRATLSFVSLPRDLVITTPVPETVGVRLRGRRSDLRMLSSQVLEAPVDVNWATPGEATITLRAQAINVPEDVEVVAIDPNKITFRIEALRQRAVPIRPFLIGQPPDGYLVGEATLDPDRALVSGPASHILKMSEVATERVIMTGRTATFVQSVAVISDSPLVRVISPLTTSVTVPVLAEIGPNPPPPATVTTTTTGGESQEQR